MFIFWLPFHLRYSLYAVVLIFVVLCSLQKELNGMIVQEKIVESKHQKKEITEVCVLIWFFTF